MFIRLQTAWTSEQGVLKGIAPSEIRAVMDITNPQNRSDIFDDLLVMQTAVLKDQAERREQTHGA